MRFSHVVAAAALLSASLAAHADTITQTFTGSATGDHVTMYEFEPATFNPALGTLNSITSAISGTFVTSADNNGFVNIEDTTFGTLVFHTVFSASTSGGSFAFTDTTTAPHSLFEAQNGGGSGLGLEIEGSLLVSSSVTDVLTYNYTPAIVPPVAVTPEPSSLALLGTGILGVAGVMRKRFA